MLSSFLFPPFGMGVPLLCLLHHCILKAHNIFEFTDSQLESKLPLNESYLEFSVQFSSVMSDSLWPHRQQHGRFPCSSPTPGACLNSCPSSQWCHPAISSSVITFSSCPQSFPASESFPMSQLFTSGGQSFGVSTSASVLSMNIQGWFPLGWTGGISLQSKGL